MSALKDNQENPPRITRRLKYGTDRFILVKDRRLHYLEAGRGEALLFLPAPPSVRRIWKRLAPLLAGEYHTILLDDYGTHYGRKMTKRESVAEQVETLALMVRQLALPRVNLVSSVGGVPLDLASRYPGLTGKIAILGGPVMPELASLEAARLPSSIRDTLEKLKQAAPPVLYIYGGRADSGRPAESSQNPAVRRDIDFLQACLHDPWIAELETGLFRSVLKDPNEIAGIIKDFLAAGQLPA